MAKQEEILATLDRWRSSGKSRTAFAREEGISINTFHYWCLKYDPSKQEKQKSKPAPPTFVELPERAQPVSVEQARLRLALPDGLVITVF